MSQYIKTNLFAGLRTAPTRGIKNNILFFILFAIIALVIGFSSGLFTFEILNSELIYFLPLTLFIFPSLFEETIFRGLLIPNDTCLRSRKEIVFYSLISSILFVLWHPLNALTINPNAQIFFLDPWFLLVAFALGLVCSLGYIFSRSLWVPIIMHWLTVVIWVFLLGGRNLVIES